MGAAQQVVEDEARLQLPSPAVWGHCPGPAGPSTRGPAVSREGGSSCPPLLPQGPCKAAHLPAQLLPWLGPVVTPCRGVLRGLPAAGDSIVPGVASLLQQELGMPTARSIPALPGSGVDQPALLEAVVCAIWLTSSPGPPGPVSWGCLRLLQTGSKPQGREAFMSHPRAWGSLTRPPRGAEPWAGCCRHRAGGRQAASQILLARVRAQRAGGPVWWCCHGELHKGPGIEQQEVIRRCWPGWAVAINRRDLSPCLPGQGCWARLYTRGSHSLSLLSATADPHSSDPAASLGPASSLCCKQSWGNDADWECWPGVL